MKPFSLQSPEIIAKEYGGNKQKIAQAAQMGMLDPTSAVLAGMFIDRIRGAQTQEQQPQTTVAQKVFSPPQMPQQQMSPQQQAMPPQQMQSGVAALPAPYDESSFAGGGIVAFAEGGRPVVDLGLDRLSQYLKEKFRIKNKDRYDPERDFPMGFNIPEEVAAQQAEDSARVSGVPEFTGPSAGLRTEELDMALSPQPPSAGLAATAPARNIPQAAPEAPIPEVGSIEEYMAQQRGLMGGKTSERDALMQYYREQQAGMKDRKKEDMWSALAQFGFGMAGTDSPYALQAAGQAGSAVMPTIQKMQEARRADELAAMQGKAGLEQVSNEETRAIAEAARGERRADVTARQEEVRARRSEKAARDLVELQAALNPNDFQAFLGNPEMFKQYLEAKSQVQIGRVKSEAIRMAVARAQSDPEYMGLKTPEERTAYIQARAAEFEAMYTGQTGSMTPDMLQLFNQADSIIGLGGL